MPTEAQVIIIGAGPGGLAMAGQLRERHIPFLLLERGEGVAQSWRHHYDRLHLHTVKELSHLPDYPFPPEYERYVGKDDLVRYYERYVADKQLHPVLRCTVNRILPENGRWQVLTAEGKTLHAPYVIVATGMNRVPYRPYLAGEEDYRGRILHGADYQNPEPFTGQRVLVVGMGNSGAEIALDLSEHGVKTAISVRGPVNIVPREILGRPTQLSALLLAKLPTWLGDRIGLLVRQWTVGDLPRYGIRLPAMSPARQLRELGQTPVIDLGTLDHIRDGRIQVIPAIDHCTESGVMARDGELYLFDALLLATGFRAQLEELIPAVKQQLDPRGLPPSPIGSGTTQGAYFIGFNNYAPGGTLGIIRDEVVQVADHLAREFA